MITLYNHKGMFFDSFQRLVQESGQLSFQAFSTSFESSAAGTLKIETP